MDTPTTVANPAALQSDGVGCHSGAETMLAAAKAAAENPADALALAESIKNREDISAADRAAALKAQQDALKKLADAAATGDAKAKEAIDKYRASK